MRAFRWGFLVSFLNLYLRGEQIIVVPNRRWGTVFRQTAPVAIVPPDPDDLQRAMVAAFEASAVPCDPADATRRKWVVLDALHLRSIRAFYRDVACCTIHDDAGRLFILRWHPAKDGKGFESDGVELPVTREAMGRTVLEILRNSPRC